MNWDLVWQKVSFSFKDIQTVVREVFPAIGSTIFRFPKSATMVFAAQLTFSHLPLTAESEDVVLELACAPAGRGGFWAGPGRPLFPETPDRHALRFEIDQRGKGTLTEAKPALLPADPNSDDYKEAVLVFTDRAIETAKTSVPLLLQALKEMEH